MTRQAGCPARSPGRDIDIFRSERKDNNQIQFQRKDISVLSLDIANPFDFT